MDTIPLLIQHAAERFHDRTALIQPSTGNELSSLSFDHGRRVVPNGSLSIWARYGRGSLSYP